MATRTKTVEFAHPPLASLTDNSLTTMTQITVYLPESSKVFRSVIAQVSANGNATATGNITTRQLQCRLGAAGYTAHTNSNLHTGSTEDIHTFHSVDLTSHFTTNWTGTSMTFDSQVLLDGTATGIAWTNVCVTLYVTYDYDDTSSTHIKTVRIPLNMPVTNLASTKPSSLATIPNLSTELPEASKTFRNHFVTVQGNINRAATTDSTMTLQLDSTTAHTTGVFEGLSNTDFFFRYIWDAPTLNTSASMSWYAYGNSTDFNHLQAWLTVTYEFDATSSNDVFVSVILPMEVASPMGGTSSSDFQRGKRELWIQEPGTITTRQIAFFPFWDQAAAIAGLNMRIGTGSFVTYTDVSATVAGSNAAMVRNDGAFSFTRGRNSLNFDVYRTDTTDIGMNVSGFWIVNYIADKPSQGYGTANHTIFHNLGATFDGAASALRSVSAIAPTIADSSYFISSVGINYEYMTNSTGIAAGVSITAERLAAGEGGLIWEDIYADVSYTDPESGLHQIYATARSFFKRWTGDVDDNRVDVETARRYRVVLSNKCASFDYLDMLITYHSITSTVSGDVTGSAGGNVDISLHRAGTGERVLSTSRTGNGSYSFTWFDDTEPVFVEFYEDDTHKDRSAEGLATLD